MTDFDGTYRHPQRHGCPYERCSAIVRLMPARPSPDADWTLLVPVHDIQNRYLSGTCPASLMYHPLSPEARSHLNRMSAQDGRKISRGIQEDMDREEAELFEPPKPRPESRSLRGPHRIGREPVTEEDQEDWALGGREDEDSGKLTPTEDIPIKRPALGMLGHVMGRKAVSLSDIIGMNQQAAFESGEAIGVIQQAQNDLNVAVGKLGETLNTVATMQGESGAQLLVEYYSLIQTASRDVSSCVEQLEEIKRQIAAGQEKGSELVARILGS